MRVSVVVPTYNYGRFLRPCLDSVLRQTVRPDEIVVVDDGSTDETAEIMTPYLSEPNIRFIRTGNFGEACARNTAISAATGDIIAVQDSDNTWEPNKLELQLPLFDDPEVGVVYCGFHWFNQSGHLGTRRVKRMNRDEMLRAFVDDNPIPHSTALIRRKCLDDVGLYVQAHVPSADYHLFLRIAAAGYRFDCVEKPLAWIRTGHDSLSSQMARRMENLPRILDDVFLNPPGRDVFSRAMVRRAWGGFYAARGQWQYEQRRRWAAAVDSLRCIARCPSIGAAWRLLAKSVLPPAVVARLRSPA